MVLLFHPRATVWYFANTAVHIFSLIKSPHLLNYKSVLIIRENMVSRLILDMVLLMYGYGENNKFDSCLSDGSFNANDHGPGQLW